MKKSKNINPRLKKLRERYKKFRSESKSKPENAIYGSIIKKQRKASQLTVQQLANLTGIGRTQITNIELGNSGLTIRNLIKICQALQITPNHILGFKE